MVETSIRILNSILSLISSHAAFVYVITPTRCPLSQSLLPCVARIHRSAFTRDRVFPDPAPAYKKKQRGASRLRHCRISSSTPSSMAFSSRISGIVIASLLVSILPTRDRRSLSRAYPRASRVLLRCRSAQRGCQSFPHQSHRGRDRPFSRF